MLSIVAGRERFQRWVVRFAWAGVESSLPAPLPLGACLSLLLIHSQCQVWRDSSLVGAEPEKPARFAGAGFFVACEPTSGVLAERAFSA